MRSKKDEKEVEDEKRKKKKERGEALWCVQFCLAYDGQVRRRMKTKREQRARKRFDKKKFEIWN